MNYNQFLLIFYPLSCIIFYGLDRISVQTRYMLVIVPLIFLASLSNPCFLRRKRLFFIIIFVGLFANGLIFYNNVQPHIRNKIDLVYSTNKFIENIKKSVPGKLPIAVYAIGQYSFYLKNPIIDTGGIILPESIKFMGDDNKIYLWAWSKGARCFIASKNPSPGLSLIEEYEFKNIGWLYSRSFYDDSLKSGIYCDKVFLQK